MEEISAVLHEESSVYHEKIITDEEEVNTLSVDKFTLEKVVLESPSSIKVLFTTLGSSETVSTSIKRIAKRTRPEKWFRGNKVQDYFDAKIQKRRTNGSEKLNGVQSSDKSLAKIPASRVQKAGAVSVQNGRKLIPIKFKSSSLGSLMKFDEFGKYWKHSNLCKVPPIIPPKPIRKTKYDPYVNLQILVNASALPYGTKGNVDNGKNELDNRGRELEDSEELISTSAQARRQPSQFEIEKFENNLVNIDLVTAEAYEQKLPILHLNQLKFSPISDECLSKNTEAISDEDFSAKHNYNQKLRIERKQFLETDFNYVPDVGLVPDGELRKPGWSREVSEIERRWSGEFLNNYNDLNSSESSKSSYIEELGSVSSQDGVIDPIRRESRTESFLQTTGTVQGYHKDVEEVSEDIISAIDSTSCVEEKIKLIDEGIGGKVCRNNSDKSHDRTLKELALITAWLAKESLPESNRIYDVLTELEETVINHNPEQFNSDETTSISGKLTEEEAEELGTSDGYAELIREMTMEPGPSKCKGEKKKRSALRRLLPGLFSPKESRKDYKKEQKERKKRDERHFSQHQQNGIYTRSPDTMNLNEDIKQNVNLDTSLNGSIIEERLNEIKQELFPDQGMATSTPDHFLQDRSFHDRRTPRMYTTNSSMSSIALEDKWIDQKIISGSPDMKKIGQQNKNDSRRCILQHKHSFQESHPRFVRNHAPSGRLSAPPSERHLIRPRAVHPIDRPLPAIPQKIEFSNYQNHEEFRKHPAYSRESTMDYQSGEYYARDRNYSHETKLYENSNHLQKIEINRNQSIDSGFNLTTVSIPVKKNQQLIVTQSGEKSSVHATKSPKYSPSSSQKSGDYADSNYTHNSSQKSEFSPGSSKSGEYYLNSPRNSCQMSPDISFNRDQADGDKSMTSRQVPSNIMIQMKDDNLYDEAHRSLSVSPRQPNPNTNQEPTYIRGSPNIPLSTNLAKLRAHVESTRPESPTNSDNKVRTPRLSSSSTINSSLPSLDQSEKCPLTTPATLATMIPRITSPLTVFMPESQVLMVSERQNRSNSLLNFAMVPTPRSLIETESSDQLRTPISSPIISQMRTTGCTQMSTSQPRKAQPNDQILIASPKREAIYEQHSPSRGELGYPDSPVPMTDSPSQVLSANHNHRFIGGGFERCKAPNHHELPHQSPPQAFQDRLQESMSPQIQRLSPAKVIQRPEPIYIKRQAPQRMVSSLAITSAEEPNSGIPSERSNKLLLQASTERISCPSSTSSTQDVVYHQNLQSSPESRPEVINMQQRIIPQPISPPSQNDPNIFPEKKTEVFQLRKKSLSPFHERPHGIYGDQNASAERIYGRKMTPPVPMSMRSSLAAPHLTPSIYINNQEILTQEQIYSRQRIVREHIDVQRSHKRDPIYGQRMSEPIYGQNANKQSSPSKRQTLQHLEAFYWQQKALEDQRTSASPSAVSNRSSQVSKVEPEVREAIYWQQLKKLNDEQQRKIFERNQFEEINEMAKKKLQIQSPIKEVNHRQEHLPQMYWQIKAQPNQNVATRPPLVGQKVQNQPVLVVRPQQAVRDQNVLKNQRSKSVSPHFVRNDERRSLQLPKKCTQISGGSFTGGKLNSVMAHKSTTPIYEENENRKNPPPIFKRGSLISNSSSSVEYGTMGTKRVSFSNQSNLPEIGSGNWPTKYGLAPEPPTRKHRTEETIPDTTDLSFTRIQEENQNNANNIYGNISYGSEYDAKPLPPPPTRNGTMIRRSNSMRDNRNQRVEVQRGKVLAHSRIYPSSIGRMVSESESGSEAGEVQRILQRRHEEEWNPGGKGRQSNDTGGSGRTEGEGGSNELPSGRRSGGIGVLGNVGVGRASSTSGSGGGRSRDEPRRHTLSGDHAPSLHHQQFNAQQLHPLHPHHLPPPHGQYNTAPRHGTMDLEMGTKSRQRKSPLPRGYPPPSTAMLFDEDPGIMSEVETSSTGFRRGGKQRSSLPVVRTPSKTLERPLGLVFLQYRKETKRALLPNEITSIDTVKALFVRSFPKQLTMEYLDSPDVKVYIHDSNKDMFYELEDHRSHLRDIRDRSVLRLIEKNDIVGMPGPLQGVPVGGQGLPPHWEDQSYFSEPEFDSEFQHQHIHKSKATKNSTSGNYYMGGSSTLPRGGSIMRAYSPAASAVLSGPNATSTQPKVLGTPGGGGVAPAKPLRGYQCSKTPLGSLGGSARFSRDSSVSLYSIPDRIHGESGYMSSPERGVGVATGIGRYPGPYSTQSSYEEPYYSQYSGTVTPVIDEEARIRVEHMERQLANLTGLVQKALTHAPHTSPSPRDYLQVPAGRDPYTRNAGAGDEFDKHSSSSSASLPDDSYLRTDVKPPKLGKDKSVSFEKSVSFSDEPPDMNSPKQHSPQHTADTKPTKPAIKSSTLPRMSSQERDRHKPNLPPKPVALAAGGYVYRDLALTPEMYNQLRGLQKKAKDLRQEVRNLRRMSQAQAHTVRETIRDTFITIRAMLLSGGETVWAAGDSEKIRLSREEDLYKQEMIRLEKDLTELESTVEELRGNVINRKTRVNMSDVENMALILSKSSKTVADLKVRFPNLQEGMKGLLSSEMEKVVREEKFLKEEPERLESALRRCKKLTGTLVTLKRLASVQEQRLPNAVSLDSEETPPITPTSAQHSKTTAPVPAERTHLGSASLIGGGSNPSDSSTTNQQRPENALDALLDELQTFSRPSSQLSQVSLTNNQINHIPTMLEIGRSSSQIIQSSIRPPNISEIGRKGSIDSSSSATNLQSIQSGTTTLRRLHSYPSSSDTDTSPPIARIQVNDNGIQLQQQKPPVPERNAELLQLATSRRVPPPPPPRTSSRSPLASPTSPQLPPRNPTGTLRRGRGAKEINKPPMALPGSMNSDTDQQAGLNNILSTSNSSSCESINSQEGMQNKKGRQEQLEQRHQELLRKQKALQEQYARLQQLQRNTSGLTTVPPTPPDLLKKTGSESNLLAKMGLSMSAANSGSLTSLTTKNNETVNELQNNSGNNNLTTTSKIYETDIL